MAGQDADGDNQKGAEEHRIVRLGELQKQNIKACAGNGCAGVNMLFQDKRRLAGHDITQDAASDAGNDTEKDKQEMVFSVTCFHPGVNACNGEGAKTDGVQNIHDFFIAFHVAASE